MTPPAGGDAVVVMKLGGSLLDLPSLPDRLARFLDDEGDRRVVLLVGGGDAADLARRWDALHAVGAEAGHQLAVHAMRFNMHLLASVMARCGVVTDQAECQTAWARDQWALVDPVAWLAREEARGRFVPRRWSFTSDSIAAHLAEGLSARRLVLLKSTTPAGATSVADVVRCGIADEDFAESSHGVPVVELVNLRAQPAQRVILARP